MAKLHFFPTIGKTLKNAVKEVYQSFTYSILTSMVSALSYLPMLATFFAILGFIAESFKRSQILSLSDLFPVIVWGLAIGVIWNSLVAAPVTTAFYGLYQEKKEGYPRFKTFFKLIGKYYKDSVAVNGIWSSAGLLLFTNMYIALIEHNVWMTIIGVVSFYLTIILSLMPFYFAPLIHLNNGFKKTIKKAFLLALDNVGITIGLMLVLGVFFVISVIIPVFWFLTFGAFLVYVTDFGFTAIYGRYD